MFKYPYNQNIIPLHFADPLVNVSMKPDTHVKVTISAHQETEVREELIPVYQTVGQFKAQLNQWFHIPIQNMKLYYCDQVRHETIYVFVCLINIIFLNECSTKSLIPLN